jgi:hypothetical protein
MLPRMRISLSLFHCRLNKLHIELPGDADKAAACMDGLLEFAVASSQGLKITLSGSEPLKLAEVQKAQAERREKRGPNITAYEEEDKYQPWFGW